MLPCRHSSAEGALREGQEKLPGNGQGRVLFPSQADGGEAWSSMELCAELQILTVPLSQGLKHVPTSPAQSQARPLRVLGTAVPWGMALSRRGWISVLCGPCHTACHIGVSQEAAW